MALPIDSILLDAVHVIERYSGHDAEVTDRLTNILRNARRVRGLIHAVGKRLAPADAVPVAGQPAVAAPPRFPNVRVLVVDADEPTLRDAHAKLEPFGCTVETARSGIEAVAMVRNGAAEAPYGVIISEVRLPDMGGHNLLVHLKAILPRVPMALMQGFGYDPGHAIVKARLEGLHPRAVLFKPFKINQLIEVISTILACP